VVRENALIFPAPDLKKLPEYGEGARQHLKKGEPIRHEHPKKKERSQEEAALPKRKNGGTEYA